MPKQRVAIEIIPWDGPACIPAGVAGLQGATVEQTPEFTKFIAEVVEALEGDGQVLGVLPLDGQGRAALLVARPS